MEFVTPLALICNSSESISIELLSTGTERTPLENAKPVPATDDDNAMSFAFAVIYAFAFPFVFAFAFVFAFTCTFAFAIAFT